jgi:hypothetical protein
MKTDELVEMLSLEITPVDRTLLARTWSRAGLASGIAALGIACLALGVRPDLFEPRALSFITVKLAFTIAVFSLALVYLKKLARPGGERRLSFFMAALPFVAIIALAAMSLGLAPQAHWDAMIVGDKWLECLLSIPIIAILPFAISIWAVRQAAPTDLLRTGAFAGLVAGGVSAMAYSLHCTDDSLPFIAVWYGGTIVLCTLAGAALGPRLLRW